MTQFPPRECTHSGIVGRAVQPQPLAERSLTLGSRLLSYSLTGKVSGGDYQLQSDQVGVPKSPLSMQSDRRRCDAAPSN